MPKARSTRPARNDPARPRSHTSFVSDEIRAGLRQRLGDLDLLDELSDEDLAALQALFQDARRQQREALAAAQQHALRFVPALLRKPLLKLFTE